MRMGISYEAWDISVSRHRPLHWYADDCCYWLTGTTLHHTPYFRSDARKERLVDEMLRAADAWAVELVAWTVLEHHYHLILRTNKGRSLPRFVGRLHGLTAIQTNREDGTPGRQVWRQYWDTLIRSEGDFWSRINYIWWNPVRHGFCFAPEEWVWTNLGQFMVKPDEPTTTVLKRFPAPLKLPGDVF
jgi:putative transposase